MLFPTVSTQLPPRLYWGDGWRIWPACAAIRCTITSRGDGYPPSAPTHPCSRADCSWFKGGRRALCLECYHRHGKALVAFSCTHHDSIPSRSLFFRFLYEWIASHIYILSFNHIAIFAFPTGGAFHYRYASSNIPLSPCHSFKNNHNWNHIDAIFIFGC